MKRDLEALSRTQFDVLVIGGGIYGAIAAWDAALRGLRVALIERHDFGSASSQNSLKIIHGGLRYLQDGNPARVRTMANERTTWMKIAPHLVHPLPCLTPTYPKLSRSRLAMQVALRVNDLLSYDRNQLSDHCKYLPNGQVISPTACGALLPGLDLEGITGAATWHDGQINNSERLLLSFVIAASRSGAVVANYVEACSYLQKGTSITGVKATDKLSGQPFEARAKVVLNCTGAWTDQLLSGLDGITSNPVFRPSVGLNLVTDQIWENHAVGLPSQPKRLVGYDRSRSRSQILFIVPWQNKSIIGTWHIPWLDQPDEFRVNRTLLQEFIDAVNSAHPALMLTPEDVHYIHYGFLPMIRTARTADSVKLLREGRVIDHQVNNGYEGLVSMVGVKFTTARVMAQRGIDLVVRKLGAKVASCQTHRVAVAGGQMEGFHEFLVGVMAQSTNSLPADIMRHLVYTYGSDYKLLLDYIREQPSLGERVLQGSPVIKAEVVHGVRQEMAQTLGDVVQRRTELGATGPPDLDALRTCADLMGQELQWSETRQLREIEAARSGTPTTSHLVTPLDGNP